MRDVDARILGLAVPRPIEEVPVVRTERVDHQVDLVARETRHAREGAPATGPSDGPLADVGVGERPKDPLGVLRVHLGQRAIGILCEGALQSAGVFVVFEVDRSGATAVRPVVVGALQRMLQHRQAVLPVAQSVGQAVDQARRELRAHHERRPFHRLPQLLAREAWHEIARLVHRLGEPLEQVAVPEKVAPHRDHHEHRRLARLGEAQEQVHEVGRFGAAAGVVRTHLGRQALVVVPATEREELLELVHEHEQARVRREVLEDELARPAGEREPHRGLEAVLAVDHVRAAEGRGELGGEVVHGRIARAAGDRDPVVAIADEEPGAQARDQSGAHQR